MSTPECNLALKGHAYRGSDGAVTCCLCDFEMEWAECQECCGDGGFDGYEEDPNWYHPGEIATCHMCNGRGGDYWCPNNDCGTQWAIKIHKEKPSAAQGESAGEGGTR